MRKLSWAMLFISILFTIAGIAADVLAWMHLIAKEEPQVVLHLSTTALIFSGFGGVVSAITNLELTKKK